MKERYQSQLKNLTDNMRRIANGIDKDTAATDEERAFAVELRGGSRYLEKKFNKTDNNPRKNKP